MFFNRGVESRLKSRSIPFERRRAVDASEEIPMWAKAYAHPAYASVMLPQAVAHRGYSAAYPENTMAAFRGAVQEAGAHAIETDVHLTKDGVLVLAHDIDLKRCFGREEKLADLDFAQLADIKTLKAPHESIPSLEQLLQYLAQPENAHIWLLLDIKLHDDAATLFTALAKLLAHAPSPRPWSDRVLIGCWNPAYMALAQRHLPAISLAHIGLSASYAAQTILPAHPHCSLNLSARALVGLSTAQRNAFSESAVFAWTVNDDAWMAWCVANTSLMGQKIGGIDAVVTDDPRRFNDMCRNIGLYGIQKTQRAGLLALFKAWLIKMAMNLVSSVFLMTGWYGRVTVKTIKPKME